jgi:hypothetical protein
MYVDSFYLVKISSDIFRQGRFVLDGDGVCRYAVHIVPEIIISMNCNHFLVK